MSNVAALNFRKELAEAEVIASARRRELAEAPELTAEQILDGFKRELRSVVVPGFGTIYHYHPLSAAEYFEIQSKLDGTGETTAANVVSAIICVARNQDGSQKFKQEHAAALIDAPMNAVLQLAGLIIPSHNFAVASAEKK